MTSSSKCYVTTPIYYVTAAPHLGSLYSTLLADIVARWSKVQGKKTFFLTGTDEHGQKVAQAAEKVGKDPKEFVDSFIHAYKNTWKLYEIEYDHFMRTTDAYHVRAVQEWIADLQKKGDIYKSFYEGWYCTHCEAFVTEKESEQAKKDSLPGPSCPTCSRDTHYVAEEAYFFKLSKYQDALLAWYEQNPEWVTPKERIHEVINFVRAGLKDLSISRTTVSWGIPFPNDSAHVAYVWADALNNYITAVGYRQAGREQEFNTWWPADVQILGKDILRFHAIYWPAFLMASGLSLPKKLLVHGWIKVDKQKMSKSLGNVVNPVELYEHYGADAVRYYLARQIAITHDSDFTIGDLEKHIGSDLANDLGNLLNRMLALAEKNNAMTIAAPSSWGSESQILMKQCATMQQEYAAYMDQCLFHMALGSVFKFIHEINAYFHADEPWKLAKQDSVKFNQVLSATAHGLEIVGYLLWPVMPKKMEQLLTSLGTPFSLDKAREILRSDWQRTFNLVKTEPLFVKPVEKKEEAVTPEIPQNYITIDDVLKVELVVGTIEECEIVSGSDKLLKMAVNFGSKGNRQILAGIRASYQPADLIGKQGIFVYNLKPRAMMGMESQGMMLVAESEGGMVKMATVAQPVPNGTRLR
jgi:methionyl-tRNA synthetase